MSERPAEIPAADPPRPRPSASAIALAKGPDGWRVLLGQRSRRARFMPGHLAFPGGGVEAVDRLDEPGGYARCVSREVREECGLDVAPERWVEAGERITPPMFPVRFRTRFFVVRVEGDVLPSDPATAENERLVGERPSVVLARWERGEAKVPPPVLPILRALAEPFASIEEAASRIERANGLEERAPRIEFVPGLWMVPLRTSTLPPATHTNVWLPGAGRFAIVDPGTDDEEEVARLRRVIERRREAGGEPACILLTHHHRDHVGGAALLAAELGVPVRAHAETLERLSLPSGLEARPVADDERLDLDGVVLRALHTPGHAPGHLAWHLPAERVLIAGDLVSGLSTIVVDPDDGTMDAYLGSLEAANRLGARLLLPGHGPPLPGAALRRVIDHRLERERLVVERLETGSAPLEAIAAAIYRDAPDAPATLTRRQTLAHLLRLERSGRVERAAADSNTWLVSPRASRKETTAERIRARLEAALHPRRLEIVDESHRHVGHPGATSGGGHFHLVIVSDSFEGLSRIEQHRRVHRALRELMADGAIHAVALDTRAPSERRDDRS